MKQIDPIGGRRGPASGYALRSGTEMGEITRQQEIEEVFFERPHVVILGAGASIAAVPRDRNGRKLPDMRGLAGIEEIQDLLAKAGASNVNEDFEATYSRLRADGEHDDVTDRIDQVVRDYFAEIEIGDEPTIYDHLLLGLRSKDLVATFNWDPLIVQAEMRLRAMGANDLPQVVFLHGNVAIGACIKDETAGLNGWTCPKCGRPLEPVPLLYPVTEKNYDADEFIRYAWDTLRWGLGNARVVTIFGYRAPESDVVAIKEFKGAWGTPDERQFEQFEIIGRPGSDREATRAKWDDFIHTHHYDIWDDFFSSWIAQHPRRTGEIYFRQYIEAKFVDVNPVPCQLDLRCTIDWYEELMRHEGTDPEEG